MIDTNFIISAALFPNGRVAAALMKTLMPPDRMVELEAFLFKASNPLRLYLHRKRRLRRS